MTVPRDLRDESRIGSHEARHPRPGPLLLRHHDEEHDQEHAHDDHAEQEEAHGRILASRSFLGPASSESRSHSLRREPRTAGSGVLSAAPSAPTSSSQREGRARLPFSTGKGGAVTSPLAPLVSAFVGDPSPVSPALQPPHPPSNRTLVTPVLFARAYP